MYTPALTKLSQLPWSECKLCMSSWLENWSTQGTDILAFTNTSFLTDMYSVHKSSCDFYLELREFWHSNETSKNDSSTYWRSNFCLCNIASSVSVLMLTIESLNKKLYNCRFQRIARQQIFRCPWTTARTSSTGEIKKFIYSPLTKLIANSVVIPRRRRRSTTIKHCGGADTCCVQISCVSTCINCENEGVSCSMIIECVVNLQSFFIRHLGNPACWYVANVKWLFWCLWLQHC